MALALDSGRESVMLHIDRTEVLYETASDMTHQQKLDECYEWIKLQIVVAIMHRRYTAWK